MSFLFPVVDPRVSWTLGCPTSARPPGETARRPCLTRFARCYRAWWALHYQQTCSTPWRHARLRWHASYHALGRREVMRLTGPTSRLFCKDTLSSDVGDEAEESHRSAWRPLSSIMPRREKERGRRDAILYRRRVIHCPPVSVAPQPLARSVGPQ